MFGGDGNDQLYAGRRHSANRAGANDVPKGGAGDNLYHAATNGLATTIVEHANIGTDPVMAFASYTRAANLENLTLANVTRAVAGTGNQGTTSLTGNVVDTTLSGLGGDDGMTGGGPTTCTSPPLRRVRAARAMSSPISGLTPTVWRSISRRPTSASPTATPPSWGCSSSTSTTLDQSSVI